jgi:hypothetical protein
MKKSDLDGNESFDFRNLFSSASPSEIQAACLYEYMRESQKLRDELNVGGKSDQELQAPFYPNVMFARVLRNVSRLGRSTLQSPFLPNLGPSQLGVLFVALGKAGFRPWVRLNDASKTQLVSLLTGITESRFRGNKETYPPVVIEEGWAEFDHLENCWRIGQLEPFELSLFKGWEHSGRKCFFGFIRIDTDYNESEAVEAFRTEFKKHRARTRGGGSTNWRARLKELAVMRIWRREPNQWKRLKLVAECCEYKGCMEELAAYSQRRKEGHGDEPMSEAAKVEISRARSEARKFFQTLFPSEEPLSYRVL